MTILRFLRPSLALLSLVLVLVAGAPAASWAAVDTLVLGLSNPSDQNGDALYARPGAPPTRGGAWPSPNASFYVDWAYNNSKDTYWTLHDGFRNWNGGGDVGPATTNQYQFGPKIAAMMSSAKTIIFLCAGVNYRKGAAAPGLDGNGNPAFGQYTNYELSVIANNKAIFNKVQWKAGTQLSKNGTANAFCQ